MRRLRALPSRPIFDPESEPADADWSSCSARRTRSPTTISLKFFSHACRAACCRWWPERPERRTSVERYRVEHETRYAYRVPVSQSWQLAHLTPRELPWQHVVAHELRIEPAPDERHEDRDAFGNGVTHFGVSTGRIRCCACA